MYYYPTYLPMARKILDFMQDISFSSNDYFDKEKITTLCVKFLSHLCCCFFYQLCHFLQLHIVFYGIQVFHCLFILLVLCNLCRYSNLNVKVSIVNILLLFVEPNILSIIFDYIQLFFLLLLLNQFSICFIYILCEENLPYLVVSNMHVCIMHTLFFVFVNSELQY